MNRLDLRALAAVQEVARDCVRRTLSASRRVVVFGEEDVAAALMVVGVAPGAEEDDLVDCSR